jgi:hypothetical protein
MASFVGGTEDDNTTWSKFGDLQNWKIGSQTTVQTYIYISF